jgi:hypothetical protein
MQINIEYKSPAKGMYTADVPTGKLKIVRVPGHGLMGIHKPHEGRSQVMVPAGKVKTVTACQDALIEAWKIQVGIGEMRY